VPFTVENGRTVIPLHFDAAASMFIVFSKAAAKDRSERPKLKQVAEVSGPWQVEFPSQKVTFDKLTSWTEHTDPAIKYFSGAAVYSTKVTLPSVTGTTILNLGTVDSLAKVRVNGQDVGTVWKFPYSVDISAAVKSGDNTLEVEVVNNWLNRLVGDAQPGVTKPETFAATKTWKADTRLQSSGLLGPVTIMAGE
jgi:hypothetical protein